MAAGPAIFVNQGSVTIVDSNSIGQSATAGTGASNGTADATPVFNFAGMVNGSSTAGPIAGAFPPPTDVSSQVSVTQTGFLRNRVTGIWSSTMTVTNVGATPIAGPVQVLFTNLTAGVGMTNKTGMYQGAPFLTVSAGTMAPGASVSVSIQFSDPSNSLIQFTPATDTGVI